MWLISDMQGREHYEPFVNKLCLCPQTNSSPILSQDCRDDDSGAQNTGMRGILVRTGKYSMAQSFLGTVVDSVTLFLALAACVPRAEGPGFSPRHF